MSDENDNDDKTVVDEPEKVNPAPDVTPPPVTPPKEADNSLTDIVNELREKVTHLEGVVAGLTDTEKDSTPASLPWTHRGGRG